MTRYSYCNFDNNATTCYNRILCAIATLCDRKYGVHKDVVFVHEKTLEEAEFKLKISTKMSETSYKHYLKFPIHRTGQGSTNSPTIWCFFQRVIPMSQSKSSLHPIQITRRRDDRTVPHDRIRGWLNMYSRRRQKQHDRDTERKNARGCSIMTQSTMGLRRKTRITEMRLSPNPLQLRTKRNSKDAIHRRRQYYS